MAAKLTSEQLGLSFCYSTTYRLRLSKFLHMLFGMLSLKYIVALQIEHSVHKLSALKWVNNLHIEETDQEVQE
jgi:hypothetical protein